MDTTAKSFTIDNPLPPLWMMFPGYARDSLFWRMGYGEAYAMRFGEWFDKLSPTDAETYRQQFPEPPGWWGFYDKGNAYKKYAHLRFTHQQYTLTYWQPDGKPVYTLASLQTRYTQGEHIDFLFFWGHQPAPNGLLSPTCLSQWWMADFLATPVAPEPYCCMEQYMMAEKARLFGDDAVLKQILAERSPKKIKALGRKVHPFDGAVWDAVKHTIILQGSYYKFTQHTALRNYLLNTGDAVLAEASPYDAIWGIKLDAHHKDALNPCAWRGLNGLGFALMEVRDEIKRVYAHYDRIDWQT